MYQRILVATDGSTLSKKAVTSGIGLAALCGAELVALKVVPRYPVSYFEGAVALAASEVSRIEKQWSDDGQAVVDAVTTAAASATTTALAMRMTMLTVVVVMPVTAAATATSLDREGHVPRPGGHEGDGGGNDGGPRRGGRAAARTRWGPLRVPGEAEAEAAHPRDLA